MGRQEQIKLDIEPHHPIKEITQQQQSLIGSKENELIKALDVIIDPASNNNYVPFPLRKTKKKKKKRLSI